jgi:transcriptional regulator with XRE-family HTH domain
MPSRNKTTNIIFGLRLRQARQRRELAQDALGVMAGLEESSSSARISRYENGVHEPPFQFVQALSRVLEVSPAYFYCPDDRLAEIILIYSSLSEQNRHVLQQTAKDLSN